MLTAVRNGDLNQFGRVLDEYGTKFQAEKTYTLNVFSVIFWDGCKEVYSGLPLIQPQSECPD